MSFEENTADFIPAPTDEEVDSAVTKSIHNVMTVVSTTCTSKLMPLVAQGYYKGSGGT